MIKSNYFVLSRELGALRPLDWSGKEEPLVSVLVFVEPVPDAPRPVSRELGALRPLDWLPKDDPLVSVLVFVVPVPPLPRPVSRELGALRPLDWSLKDEDPLVSELVLDELDFALLVPDEAGVEPLLSEPAGEEVDFAELLLSELDFALFEADELADSTPSDFMVAESMLPVGFMLLAP
ncbi:MAG TPA: hypothetical protein VGH16_01690 [Candidatus Binatia bacterium]|jgi:hypothetical protein